jgi:hypothetical protein
MVEKIQVVGGLFTLLLTYHVEQRVVSIGLTARDHIDANNPVIFKN